MNFRPFWSLVGGFAIGSYLCICFSDLLLIAVFKEITCPVITAEIRVAAQQSPGPATPSAMQPVPAGIAFLVRSQQILKAGVYHTEIPGIGQSFAYAGLSDEEHVVLDRQTRICFAPQVHQNPFLNQSIPA